MNLRCPMAVVMAALAIVSTLKVEVFYDKNQPLDRLWGNPDYIRWNEEEHVWINSNIFSDIWMHSVPAEVKKEWFAPKNIPIHIGTVGRFIFSKKFSKVGFNLQLIGIKI